MWHSGILLTQAGIRIGAMLDRVQHGRTAGSGHVSMPGVLTSGLGPVTRVIYVDSR